MRALGNTSLLDLPRHLFDGGRKLDRDRTAATEFIQDAYLTGRDAITSPRQIRPFVKTWRPLWLLQVGPWSPAKIVRDTHTLRAMLGGHYDARRVFAFMKRQAAKDRAARAAYPDDRDWRVMANIMLPVPFMESFRVSMHYGVGHDLGMVRLFLDTYPQFDNRWRWE